MYLSGLDCFIKKNHKKNRALKLGVVCNPASLDRRYRHISDVLFDRQLKLNITCFFGPQHGIRGEKQDNMIESPDFIDPVTKLPVYSLYSRTREPGDDIKDKLDAFLIDLPDIGCRIYTFMYTMANCMRAAKRLRKKVIVLDRANPIGGIQLEGNLLQTEYVSFVGQFSIPVRHGMTIGELALLFNDHFGLGSELEVIKASGWKRSQYGDELGREWVLPSPNMPTVLAANVFPGSVLFEGTNISEGRGTVRPFEMMGAPFIDPDRLAKEMNQEKLKGAYFRPIYFEPTFQKWKGERCGGVHLHVFNRKEFNAFKTGCRLLSKIKELYPKYFQWKRPPYEYELDKMPIDIIAGTSKLREICGDAVKLREFESQCEADVKAFKKIRSKYLLY